MEIIVNRQDILKELSYLQGVVEKKSTIPIIQNILIIAEKDQPLKLTATDLESVLTCSCPVTVKTPGSMLIPAKRFHELVKSLPNAEITVKSGKNEEVVVTCERSKFKLLSPNPESFPPLPESYDTQFTVPANLLRQVIPRVLVASTQEESRFALNGALINLTSNLFRMVSTDGHRLALAEKNDLSFNVDGIQKILVPKQTLLNINKILSDSGVEFVKFGKTDNHIVFELGGRIYVSRLLTGTFPNFEMVMPKNNDKSLVLESDRFNATLKRLLHMTDDVTRAVKINIVPGFIEFRAQSSGTGEGEDSIPIAYDGESFEFAFNIQYLLDFFNGLGNTSFTFEFRDGATQLLLRPYNETDFNYKYVIMPMRN